MIFRIPFWESVIRLEGLGSHSRGSFKLISCSYYIIIQEPQCYLEIEMESIKQKKGKLIINAVILLSILASFITMCWLVRDTVLACHDSIYDFIDARLNGVAIGYKRGFEYGLARGRVGFIFPAVVMIRYLINGKGNFLAIWLMQYIPIFANIGLVSYILGKKVSKVHGALFALMFLSFLQIDIWHSLITTYPLDFMYGLFIMTLGAYLYNGYLEKKIEGKRNTIRLIISVVLFYESMQVYESFIVSSLIYAILTVVYVKRSCIRLFSKDGIKKFVLTILPHFVTAVIYLIIMIIIRTHPLVDTAVSKVEMTSFDSFIYPYFVFTSGMFPLRQYAVVPSVRELLIHPGKRSFLTSFMSAAGFACIGISMMAAFRREGIKERRSSYLKMLVFFLMGISLALTFAIPHAMIPSYQEWVTVGQVKGYVPTTICYFGWTVSLVALFAVVTYIVSKSPKAVRIAYIAVVMVVSYVATCVTFGINMAYRSADYVTGTETSLKAQNFFALIDDEWVKEQKPEVIYSPSLIGVHFKIDTDEELAESLMGYDLEIVNQPEEVYDYSSKTDNIWCYRYDLDSKVGIFTTGSDYSVDQFSWTTDEPVYFITTYGGDFTVTYTNGNGETESQDLSLDAGEAVELNGSEEAYVLTIDVSRK